MRKIGLPALFFGLALAAGIVAWEGVDVVGAAFGRAGLHLLWLAPYFLVSLVLAGMAWMVIFPPGTRPGSGLVVTATWIGMSVNWLLPVAQVGGEVAKAAWLARRAVPPAMMVATALVDKVLQTATQALVALVGVGLLLAISRDTALAPLGLGLALALLGFAAAFLLLARRHGLLAKLAALAERVYLRASARRGTRRASGSSGLVGGAAGVDAGIRETCGSSSRIGLYLVIRLPSRLVIAGEIWLALHFIGYPISVAEALMIECLTQTVRSAAFAIPGAYGVQEGAFVLIAPTVGIPPEAALSVSLAKRMREVVVGLPALAFLQLTEGLSLLKPE